MSKYTERIDAFEKDEKKKKMMFKWLIFIACLCAITFILFGILRIVNQKYIRSFWLEFMTSAVMPVMAIGVIISGIITFTYVAFKLGAMLL